MRLAGWHRTLAIMFFAQLTTAIGFSIIFPFLPLYVESLGTHTSLSIEFWAGMVFSAQAVTMMITSPFWGAIADRRGRKLMVQRATFGGAIIVLLMAFARSAEELVLIRAIQGAVTGVVAAGSALVAAAAPREHTGFAMGTLQIGLWGGVALGPLIGGELAEAFGYRIPFVITSILLFIAGLVVHFGIDEQFTPQARKTQKKRGFLEDWQHILSMHGVAQTYSVRFLAGLGRSMIIPITPLFVAMLMMEGLQRGFILPVPDMFDSLLVHMEGVSRMTGWVVGIASATATASGVILGRLGDRIGHRRILIGCATASILFYLPQAFVTHPAQLLLLQALVGLAAGGLVSAPSALLARYTDPGEEGAVYGLDNSVLAGARAIAPLVGASVAVWFGLRTTFAVLGVVFFLVLLVSVLMLPRQETIAAQLQPSGAD
ncbi:MAG: MFS transporter [Anaerolineae bacterium]